jgi:outer membrane protein OmpA-like peptidoglycan-associated protein/TolA-binding protein
VACGLWLLAGCAYYNTFYNAKAAYADGLKLVEANNVAGAKPEFEAAIKKSASVIKNYPRSEWVDDALFLVGECYYQLGEYPKAIVKFENLEAAFPNSLLRDDARFYRALALIDDQEYANGIALLRSIKDQSRRLRQDAAFELAATAYRQTDYAAAVTSFREFQNEFPHSRRERELRGMLADAYFHLGWYSQAVAAYCQHRSLAPHSHERVPDDLSIAACYLLGNFPDSALRLMQRQSVDRYPEYSDRIYLLTGKALLALGRKTEAYAALRKVKTGTPSAEANLLIGRSYEQDTNFNQAAAYYDTARMRDPSSTFGAQANSRHLLIDRLLKGLKGEGDTAQSKFMLAEVYHMNLEQDSLALVQYQKVADSFPKSSFAPKSLYAVAWIKQNDLKQADSTAAWQAVIERYPKTVYAQEARKTLGLALLPSEEIEQLPEVNAESLKVEALRDSLVARKAREDSLAQLAQAQTADTLKPQVEPSGRGERSRERRAAREHGPAGPMPESLLVNRQAPLVPDTTKRPLTGPPTTKPAGLDTGHAVSPRVPPTKPGPITTPPVKPETVAKPPSPPKPGPPITPAPKPETTAKSPPAVTIPKPDTGLKPPAKPETVAKVVPQSPIPNPQPAALEPRSFFPDTGMGAVFFGHDSTRIRSEDTPTLRANVEYLKSHPELDLLLVGYCDSTGDPDYNLLLGLRRAQAVRRRLVAQGIDASRISVNSYGSEWAFGTEPDFMWQDRRCEFWTRTK